MILVASVVVSPSPISNWTTLNVQITHEAAYQLPRYYQLLWAPRVVQWLLSVTSKPARVNSSLIRCPIYPALYYI